MNLRPLAYEASELPLLYPGIIMALCTRFELANPFRPTVFKTAPSPPGHIAYGVVYAIRTHTSENLMEGLAIL